VKEETDPSEEESARKKHLDKKRKLKELFDAEYDEGESTYFDDLKGEMQRQAQVSKQSSLPAKAAPPADLLTLFASEAQVEIVQHSCFFCLTRKNQRYFCTKHGLLRKQ
jgi:hypothetical protein